MIVETLKLLADQVIPGKKVYVCREAKSSGERAMGVSTLARELGINKSALSPNPNQRALHEWTHSRKIPPREPVSFGYYRGRLSGKATEPFTEHSNQLPTTIILQIAEAPDTSEGRKITTIRTSAFDKLVARACQREIESDS